MTFFKALMDLAKSGLAGDAVQQAAQRLINRYGDRLRNLNFTAVHDEMLELARVLKTKTWDEFVTALRAAGQKMGIGARNIFYYGIGFYATDRMIELAIAYLSAPQEVDFSIQALEANMDKVVKDMDPVQYQRLKDKFENGEDPFVLGADVLALDFASKDPAKVYNLISRMSALVAQDFLDVGIFDEWAEKTLAMLDNMQATKSLVVNGPGHVNERRSVIDVKPVEEQSTADLNTTQSYSDLDEVEIAMLQLMGANVSFETDDLVKVARDSAERTFAEKGVILERLGITKQELTKFILMSFVYYGHRDDFP